MPLVVHANGFQSRLDAALPPKIDGAFRQVDLLNHPVLLLNSSYATESCELSTVGQVMQRAAAAAARAQAHELFDSTLERYERIQS